MATDISITCLACLLVYIYNYLYHCFIDGEDVYGEDNDTYADRRLRGQPFVLHIAFSGGI